MNLPPLPSTVAETDPRQWDAFAPYYQELQERELTSDNARQWLQDWSKLQEFVSESVAMTYIQKILDTTDSQKEAVFLDVIDNIVPKAQFAEQNLKEKLLHFTNGSSDVLGSDTSLILRHMRNAADLFRDENIPLLTELSKLDNEYDKITGGLKAEWEGEEKNLTQLALFLQEKDRAVRQRAWQTMMDLWLAKREALNQLYKEMVDLRQRVAQNADLPDYRAYSFREKDRFDYTPEDCLTFHDAIEEVVVPAARRIYAKKQQRLSLDTLRPWDTAVDPSDEPPLRPYQGQEELIRVSSTIFQRVDPTLADYWTAMAQENLLDLDTRSGKALGGSCNTLALQRRPFIFMNGVGIHEDVQTLLHEAGHAFHVFETMNLPFFWQTEVPMEFCEVASMTMELLAAPYLTKENGGFYTPSEAARARIEHLEGTIVFLPYMAVVDAFQHWVYTHPDKAADPANCDATWDQLWHRFIPGIEWEGFEDARMTGWHRKPHIFSTPFYYIEYGMAQVGALQIWRNSLSDHAAALAAYRHALSLGSTRPLPQLFEAAGAEFRFDTAMLRGLVELVEKTIEELETVR